MKGQIYLISSHCTPGLLQVHGEHTGEYTGDPFPPIGTEATYPVEDVTGALWKVYASLEAYQEEKYFRVPVDEAKRICERLLAPMSNPEADTSKR